MTEIYLIRHTQAEGNRYRMMQGFWDGGVTDLGKKQIEALEERLAALEEEMGLPENSTDPQKLMTLDKEAASIRKDLDDLYEKWETLS